LVKEDSMRKLTCLGAAMILAAGLCVASPRVASNTFTGSISDSMCGLKHMMPGGDKACTLACVKEGATYVLADTAHNKVYKLSDQQKAAQYPGAKVVVTGALNGDTIEVKSIAPAK
jgi:hypothetical protein